VPAPQPSFNGAARSRNGGNGAGQRAASAARPQPGPRAPANATETATAHSAVRMAPPRHFIYKAEPNATHLEFESDATALWNGSLNSGATVPAWNSTDSIDDDAAQPPGALGRAPESRNGGGEVETWKLGPVSGRMQVLPTEGKLRVCISQTEAACCVM
jgi:hypothetical protein